MIASEGDSPPPEATGDRAVGPIASSTILSRNPNAVRPAPMGSGDRDHGASAFASGLSVVEQAFRQMGGEQLYENSASSRGSETEIAFSVSLKEDSVEEAPYLHLRNITPATWFKSGY